MGTAPSPHCWILNGKGSVSGSYHQSLPSMVSSQPKAAGTLQGELAVEIAHALRANLTLAEKTNLATRPTENLDAYILYLRARELETRFGAGDADSEAAINLYQQALDLDPNFALARARLSIGFGRFTH